MEHQIKEESLQESKKAIEPSVQEIEDGSCESTMIRDATTADTTRSPSRTKLTIDTILRSLGLAVFQSSKDGGRKKTALDKSRSQALSRCAVHIIPIIGAIVIISLNFKALYIGATLNAITALQFAAKLHEITMVASIACIVFSYLRYQLTLGDGLPLGATIAGLELTRISYLWSLGFWGALMSPNFSLKQKVQFVLVVVPAIVLVATVGPSSAVCMIPRTSYWPAGSTDIWINGTYDELYSTFVDASGVPSTCANTSIAAGLDGCPSNSWQGLLNYIPFFNATLGPPNSNWISTTTFGVDFLTIPISVGLAGVHSIRSLYITVDDVNQGGSSDPLATIQPAPLADALVLVGSMWATLNATLYGRWSSRLDSIHTMEILQPFVGMTCNWQEVPIEGNSDARTVTFPQGMYMNTTVGYIDYDGISRSDLWNTPGDISKPRLAFVDLPDPQFSNVSVGVVILEPRNPANNTQAIIPCILAAGWGQSKMILSTGNNLQRGTAAVQSTSFVEPFQESYPTNYCFPSFPLIHINITKDWAAYMNPFLPLQNTTVFGALSSLMNNGEISTGTKQEKVNEEGIYTFLITSLLANALSNNSPSLSIQGNITVTPSGRANGNSWLFHNANMFTIPSSPQTANWTKLRIDSFVQGLSYGTSGSTVKVALLLLIAYCGCAAAHLVYCVGVSGVSSSAWDTIADLLALALGSKKSDEMGAGITMDKDVFENWVRIMATVEGGLELVLENELQEETHRKMEVGEEYGSMD